MGMRITCVSTELKIYTLLCKGVRRGKRSGDITESPKSNAGNILLNLGRQSLPLLSRGIRASAEQFPITHFPHAFWSQLHGPLLFRRHSIADPRPLLQGRHL